MFIVDKINHTNLRKVNIISKQRSNYTIIEKIKRYIIDTNLEIGDKLPTEKELCNILNVSRSTLITLFIFW
ncbi:GntR family transcriptional regulator [Staphylococcus kloosii]|nr:GntR family transcriptional regulator [Staphylococcus kloosii]